MELATYEELEQYLRNFSTFDDRGGFDFVGALSLLAALVDCLRTNAVDDELQDSGEYLNDEQVAFIQRLATILGKRAK